MRSERLDLVFARLGPGYTVLRPPDPSYNCVAWAMGDPTQWWDPLIGYWPPGAPRSDTIAAYQIMLRRRGFEPGATESPAADTTKVALYAKGGVATHLALQQANGRWSSKIGRLQVIEDDLDQLEGVLYSQVIAIFARRD